MRKVERQMNDLALYLKEAQRITIADAKSLLNVSESTARRLFGRMESQKLAIRVHGGLQVWPEMKTEYSYPSMEARRLPQKRRIARAAIEWIGDARTIFLDSGSTIYQMSLYLAEWLRAGQRPQVSIFTNSLKNLQALSGLVDIHFIGGKYRENRQDCCGFLAEEALQKLNFDLCFLGADGCNVEQGVSCSDMETARLGRLVVMHSQRKVVLIDSTKFYWGALATYAQLENLDALITDVDLDSNIAEQMRAKGIELQMV